MIGSGYDAGSIMDLADRNVSEARVCATDGLTGVALPDWVQAGQILLPQNARKLAAQLLLAADEHDLIQEQANAHLR